MERKYPTRGKRKKTLCKLALARSDMIAARIASRTFVETVDSMGHPLYYPLLCATCICYAKPFVESRASGLGPLSRHWRGFPLKRPPNPQNLLFNAPPP